MPLDIIQLCIIYTAPKGALEGNETALLFLNDANQKLFRHF